jgi:hypothetical protein
MTTAGDGKHDLQRYLKTKVDVTVRIIRFPDDINRAPALGYLETWTEDGDEKRIFVKNRDNDEAYLQAASSEFGSYFGKALGLRNLVAPAEGMERPSLDELEKDSAGEKMWIVMEATWKKVIEDRKNAPDGKEEESADDDGNSSTSSDYTAYAFAPSEYDCWQLEEAVLYAPGGLEYTGEEKSSKEEGVDASLRRKLRKAASSNPMKCIDACKLLFLPEYSQQLVKGDKEWEEYKEHDYALLEDGADALTKEETHLLFHKKLTSPCIQAAVLFGALAGVLNMNSGNISFIEHENEKTGEWRLEASLFDCDVGRPELGATLENAALATDSWARDGSQGTYYEPFMFSLPISEMPICSELSSAVLNLDTEALEQAAQRAFANTRLEGLAPLIRERAQRMQRIISDGSPSQSLRDICQKTITTWGRDWEAHKEASGDHKWSQEILDWACSS